MADVTMYYVQYRSEGATSIHNQARMRQNGELGQHVLQYEDEWQCG